MKHYGSAVLVLLVLAGLYAGAYYATVEKFDSGGVVYGGLCSTWIIQPQPEYTLGGELAEWFFKPMHRVDCRLRPEFWQPYTKTERWLP